jgi:hypothetical protein
VPTPTVAPTIAPRPTVAPAPTVVPTVAPTIAPRPTVAPAPTVVPTVAPTIAPTPTIAPNSQSPLLISNTVLTGTAGKTITLTTSGGAGTGAVTFSVTGVGCSVNGSLLGSIGVVTCVVTATRAASPGHPSSVSAPVAFTFGQQPLLVSNTVRRVQAGIAIKLAFSGGSGTGSVYYSVTGSLCNVSTSDYKEWTLTAGGATTCSVTAKNNAALGYVTTTSAPAIFEFFKLDPPPLIAQTFTDTSFTKPTSPSTLYPVGTSIYIPVKNGGPTTYTVSGANCTTRNYLTGSGTFTAFTANAAATCVVVATNSGSAGFNPVTSAPVTVSFGVFNQIPFTIRGGPGEGGNGWLGTDGGSGTGAVTFSVTGANCSLVDGNRLRATTPTSCVVTATKAASTGYNSVTTSPLTIDFKVIDQQPLIVVKESLGLSNQSPVGKVYNLSITGGSGTGVVSYSVSGANCSVSGNTLTATAVTTCAVTANKAASTFYNSVISSPVNFDFFVYNQTPLTITTNPSSLPSPAGTQISLTAASGVPSGGVLQYYGGSGTGAINFSVTGATCLISGTTLTANPTPGTFTTCAVTATKAASPGFNVATSPVKNFVFGVYEQATLTIPFNSFYNTFTARTPVTLNATGGSGSGALSYSVIGDNCSISGNILTGTPQPATFSTCVVTATKAASLGYKAAISAPITLYFNNVIDQALLVMVTTSVPAGSTSITLSTNGGSGTGAVSFSATGNGCTLQGNILTATPAQGASISCTVQAYKAQSSGYNAARSSTVTLVFTKP